MKINKDKQIINTLFIVEGEREKKILYRILHNILGYELICQDNRDSSFMKFRRYSGGSTKGTIAVFCTVESYVMSIHNQDHIDKIVQKLIEDFEFDIRNTCVFYLFDRDPNSNTNVDGIRDLILRLKNPYDNDEFSYGGLLLLSYPSFESYVISNFIDRSFDLRFSLGAEVKTEIGRHPEIQDNKIKDETILKAANELLTWHLENDIIFDYENGNYGIIDIFDFQEGYHNQETTYHLLSSLSCALIELGIIELE